MTKNRNAVDILKSVLPKFIKRKIFNLGFNLDPEQFNKFAFYYGFAPDMERGLTAACRRGLRPAMIVDVGAFEAEFARMARRIWPEASILMIEGNEEKRPILQYAAMELTCNLEIALLGRRDGEQVEFNIMNSGSSVFSENSPLERRSEVRTLRTLDSVLGGRKADFIKADVQGYELEVLSGAVETLESAQAVLLEVAILEINEGAPLMHDVIGFMAESGFKVADVLGIHRRPLDKATNQVDLLFARETSPLFADKRHF